MTNFFLYGSEVANYKHVVLTVYIQSVQILSLRFCRLTRIWLMTLFGTGKMRIDNLFGFVVGDYKLMIWDLRTNKLDNLSLHTKRK
jgi:hypothetical protein